MKKYYCDRCGVEIKDEDLGDRIYFNTRPIFFVDSKHDGISNLLSTCGDYCDDCKKSLDNKISSLLDEKVERCNNGCPKCGSHWEAFDPHASHSFSLGMVPRCSNQDCRYIKP